MKDPVEPFVGVDFGATNIRAGLVDGEGRILRRAHSGTYASEGKEKVISRIVKLVRDLGQNDRMEVGIACPGPVDGSKGIIFDPPNLPGWKKVHLKEELQDELGTRVSVENDANMVTYGEWKFGAGKGVRNLLCLTLGSGVGSGLVLNGSLYTGANGFAAELGHTIVELKGPQCRCGARGCLESLVGAKSIVAEVESAIASGHETILTQGSGEMTVSRISSAAAKGDSFSVKILEKAGFYVGVAVSNAVALLDVEMVVVGGGISKAGPLIIDPIRKAISSNLISFSLRALKVVRSQLGDDAGILGISAYSRVSGALK